ncbi:nitrogenase cofactor biosynthesis protein NifB [Magnetovibrio sp. PR-2]|uniref:nitrogenase cofactor biosynthesis protein NifB n=1 Tax=Magnetovibrio sp. PR-2 TaxID=3120356 RepID=UPI002FCE3464
MELKVLGQDNQAPQAAPSGGCSSGTCGSSEDGMSHLPDNVREKVNNHPCYSEEAHHFYARMHVAVAPACNIQCHYCNRKYDCANESRPGVVSELLSPDQASKKVLAVASEIPQMTVLGVAGPGDPLANPERTFETFREIADKAPDIKLCLSTNGLALPDHVDEIAALNVDHVTITINCVDPEIGAEIYPWIFWNNRRIHGAKGAKILIERQQKGLEMLIERGILVKVNSVMIPGVNDEHLKEVSQIVKGKGAFLHNVMPLIAEKEHGTFYGVMGQRSPSKQELSDLQDACAGDMNMMRHCRQCRADAVGLLGEDRGEEFTVEKIEQMKIDYAEAMERRANVHAGIEAHRDELRAQQAESDVANFIAPEGTPAARIAVTTKGGGVINEHFGHAKEYLVYEASPEGVRFIGPRKVDNAYCVGPDVCPSGDDKGTVLDAILDALSDCSAVLSAKVGIEPWSQLEAAGITPSGEYAMDLIEDAVKAMYAELIEQGWAAKDLTAQAV